MLRVCLLWMATCQLCTVYLTKYAHGFCFAVLCCGYTLTDFPISIRLTSLPLWQSNDCPSASKATLMNMDKYFMWIHYEWLHNHNKAKHNKTVCIFLGIYCSLWKVSFGDSITSCAHTARQLATYFWPKTNQRSTVPHHVQWQGSWFKAVFVLTMTRHSITNADWLTLLRFNPNDHYGYQSIMRHSHYGHRGCESK